MKDCARVIVQHQGQFLMVHRLKFGKEYYTLVGGHIEAGETPEQAMFREVAEEAGLQLANPVLTYIDDSTDQYGAQYIFRADYVSGDIHLSADSDEAQANAAGQNTYTPLWKPQADLADLPLYSPALKARLLQDLAAGWPAEAVTITA